MVGYYVGRTRGIWEVPLSQSTARTVQCAGSVSSPSNAHSSFLCQVAELISGAAGGLGAAGACDHSTGVCAVKPPAAPNTPRSSVPFSAMVLRCSLAAALCHRIVQRGAKPQPPLPVAAAGAESGLVGVRILPAQVL